MSRIEEARRKLNEAEAELIKINSLKDSIEKNKKDYDTISDIIGYALDSIKDDFADKLLASNMIVKIETTTGTYLFANAAGESFGEFLAGLSGDFIQGMICTTTGALATAYFLKKNPDYALTAGLGAYIATDIIIDKITDGGIDELTKTFYRRVTGDDSTNIAKKIGVKSVNIKNGIISITTNEGITYARPFTGYSGIVKGGPIATKSDVLFGGDGNDTLIGRSNGAGSDILIGGNGYDTYQVYGDNTIIDSDGKGKVELDGQVLTGGKWSGKKGVYINDDGAFKTVYTYDEKSKILTVTNFRLETVTIQNFNKDQNSLGIILQDADEILVSVSDATASEKSGKMNFKIILSRKLEKGETLTLKVGDKEIAFKEGEQEKDYEYTWKDNSNKEEDRSFEINPEIIPDKSNTKAKIKNPAHGKIIDDDRDPNEDLPETYDPIVIDFNKNGVTSTKLDNTVYFDHDNNGFAEATAWVEKDDGLLALDKNNNGKIDNGNELFGNHTISNTAYGYTDKKATNGYEALKAYDLNGDNVIDEKDEIFNKLKIWKDKNSNGITDEGELSSLADNNIKSIDLNYKEITIDENSNTIKQSSKVTLKDGSTLDANDVWMKVNLNKTEEIIDQNKLSPEAQALPQVMASGNLNSLRVAAGKNEKLATIINLYLMLNSEDRKKYIDELIYEWAGVSDIDPNSRTTSIDSRIVNVYEKLTGKPFTWHGGSDDANIKISANIIKERFDTFKRYVYATIELQTTYFDMDLNLDLMSLGEDGKLSYKFDALNSKLMRLYKDGKHDEIIKLLGIVRDASAYKPIFQENLKSNLSNFCGNDDKLLSLCLDTYISGTDSNDVINGNYEDNFINGGKGNDTLNGGAGDDTYIFARGDGNDTIYDATGNDKIKFKEGITPSDISFKRELDKLIISIKGDNGAKNDSITIQNFFSVNPEIGNNTVRTITFADGTVYDFNKILELTPLSSTDKDDKLYLTDGNDTFDAGLGNDEIWGGNGDDVINGGEGDDTLYGNDGNDTLIGGKGNDRLDGGNGNDTYVFNKGDGADTIIDRGGNDTIKFNDFSASDISLRREFRDVIITSKVSNDKIIIKDFYDNNGNAASSIKKIIFNDNSVWDYQTIINNSSIKATEEDNKFYLSDKDDIFDALGGDDEIHGQYGNDTLRGGSGNDKLYGDDGNDILNGGDGNDILDGGYGDDTYIFNKGDGNDTITDNQGADTIKFGNGIRKEDLIVKRTGVVNYNGYEEYTDITISFKNSPNDSITIKNIAINNKIATHNAIETFEFANGDKLSFEDIKNLSLIGTDEGETIKGYDDSDNIIKAGGGDDKLYGKWSNDTLIGESGNDILDGNYGNDTLVGGKGNDTLNGGEGDDIYIYNKGDGADIIEDMDGNDTLEFGEGISKEDIIVSRNVSEDEYSNFHNANDITIKFKNNDRDSIVLKDAIAKNRTNNGKLIENFKFANGEILSFEDIKKLSQIGSDKDDIIATYDDVEKNILVGNGGNDKIYGSNRDDQLQGGEGDDTLMGGDGDDIYIYNKGDGNDTISDSSGYDILKFGKGINKEDLIFYADGTKQPSNKSFDLTIKFKNSDRDSITLKDALEGSNKYYGTSIRRFQFANGETLDFKDITMTLIGSDKNDNIRADYDVASAIMDGKDGNDALTGSIGADTLIGGRGNDVLHGGDGDDTYVYNKGDGVDYIYDTKGRDILKFGKGIKKEDLIISRSKNENRWSDYDGAHRMMDIKIGFKNNDADTIFLTENIINNRTDKDLSIENFEFENGDRLSLEDIKRLTLTGDDMNNLLYGYDDTNNVMNGLGGDDEIRGGKLNDTIYGGDGNDTINGAEGDDAIYGGEGSDTVDAGDGNDVIEGGKGDDIIKGGWGDDTYIFNKGDGNDTIADYYGTDTLQFGEGITKDDIIVKRTSRGTIIKFKNSKDDSISFDRPGIDKIKFANGEELDSEGIEKLALIGTDEADTIFGNSDKDNLIIGGKGDDILYGSHSGNNTFVYNQGDGADTIYAGSRENKIKFSQGISKEDLIVKRCANTYSKGYDENNKVYDNLKISFRNSVGDSIMLGGIVKYNRNAQEIQTFEFANGDKLGFDDIKKLSLIGTDTNDEISGYDDMDNEIKGGDGDDTLTGGNGVNNILEGGGGNDTLKGCYDSYGNPGISIDGKNIFVFSRGDGNDTVENFKDNDLIKFKDIGSDEVKFDLNLVDNSLRISDKLSNSSVLIKNYNTNTDLKFQFKDGKILGSDFINKQVKPIGDANTMVGGSENNTFEYEGGLKSIVDIGGYDKVIFKKPGNKIYYSSDGTNLKISTAPIDENNKDVLEVKGFFNDKNNIVEEFQINSYWNIKAVDIYQAFGKTYIGDEKPAQPNDPGKPDTPSDNTIIGGSGNDTFSYDGGLKSIKDSGGYDKVIFKKEGNHVYYQMFGEDLKISTAPINEDNKDVLEVKGFFGNKNNIVEEFQINSYWNIKAQDIYKAFGKTYIGDAKPTALAMDANSAMNSKDQISPLSKSSSDSSNSKSGWDMVLGGDKNELKAIVSKFYNDADLSTSEFNSTLSPSGIADINTISGISQEDALKDSAFLSQNTVNKIIEQLNVYADNSEALEFNQKDIRKDDMQVYMS